MPKQKNIDLQIIKINLKLFAIRSCIYLVVNFKTDRTKCGRGGAVSYALTGTTGLPILDSFIFGQLRVLQLVNYNKY